MKKAFAAKAALVVLAVVALAFVACEKKTEGQASVLRVGATPVPHGDLLNLVKEDMAVRGITLEIAEFSDYVTPNMSLLIGDIDANFFQTLPYLQANAEWNAGLVSAFGVLIAPLGLYSSKFSSLDDLPQGASIAIPNDPSNGGRALLLLQNNGLITVSESAGFLASPLDIVDNPRGFIFHELEAAQLPHSRTDVDAAIINVNFALQAGLNPAKDAMIIEDSESPYVNVVVVKRGNENDPRILALQEALRSEKVRDFINATYNGSVVPSF
jgi:D-methionine transport system substrate-binding protein